MKQLWNQAGLGTNSCSTTFWKCDLGQNSSTSLSLRLPCIVRWINELRHVEFTVQCLHLIGKQVSILPHRAGSNERNEVRGYSLIFRRVSEHLLGGVAQNRRMFVTFVKLNKIPLFNLSFLTCEVGITISFMQDHWKKDKIGHRMLCSVKDHY